MTARTRILVVDDEPQIRRVLRLALEAQHFDVRTAADGAAALDLFHDWKPQLVVLDLTMPEEDGLSVTRRIRQESDVPVVILSVKGEEPMKVAALDAGADDYVTKPFGMDELLARIRAALRRSSAAAGATGSRIAAGELAIDLEARRVTVRGADVHLTPKEFDLLVFFARHPGRVLTHRALLTAIWGGDYASQTEYLRVFVGQLRRKLEPDPAHPRYLITEPWIGYRFDPGA
ncbi:MAG: response regulator [Vicinamibacterales bacterium]